MIWYNICRCQSRSRAQDYSFVFKRFMREHYEGKITHHEVLNIVGIIPQSSLSKGEINKHVNTQLHHQTLMRATTLTMIINVTHYWSYTLFYHYTWLPEHVMQLCLAHILRNFQYKTTSHSSHTMNKLPFSSTSNFISIGLIWLHCIKSLQEKIFHKLVHVANRDPFGWGGRGTPFQIKYRRALAQNFCGATYQLEWITWHVDFENNSKLL